MSWMFYSIYIHTSDTTGIFLCVEVNPKKGTKSSVTTGSGKVKISLTEFLLFSCSLSHTHTQPPAKRHTNSSDICSKQSLLDIRLLQMTFLNVKVR